MICGLSAPFLRIQPARPRLNRTPTATTALGSGAVRQACSLRQGSPQAEAALRVEVAGLVRRGFQRPTPPPCVSIPFDSCSVVGVRVDRGLESPVRSQTQRRAPCVTVACERPEPVRRHGQRRPRDLVCGFPVLPWRPERCVERYQGAGTGSGGGAERPLSPLCGLARRSAQGSCGCRTGCGRGAGDLSARRALPRRRHTTSEVLPAADCAEPGAGREPTAKTAKRGIGHAVRRSG